MQCCCYIRQVGYLLRLVTHIVATYGAAHEGNMDGGRPCILNPPKRTIGREKLFSSPRDTKGASLTFS